MIWRFWSYGLDVDDPRIAEIERTATRWVAHTFFILGSYVAFDASWSLYKHESPDVSVITNIGLTTLTMCLLRRKQATIFHLVSCVEHVE